MAELPSPGSKQLTRVIVLLVSGRDKAPMQGHSGAGPGLGEDRSRPRLVPNKRGPSFTQYPESLPCYKKWGEEGSNSAPPFLAGKVDGFKK